MRGGRSWRVLAVLAVLALAGQLYGLYRVAGPPTPSGFPQTDKLEHASGFALPTALVLTALVVRAQAQTPVRVLSGRTVVRVAAVFATHAVVSELVQHFFYTRRSGDPLDVVADWVGTALGVAVGLALRRRPVDAVRVA
ncbi:VanZ family protein [uncultured Friedmanniella sp.]|uniref:VanZ family protein n=1 Tax=uncultured Friedmanniella sp. TaxID=335381 RepID=UPI0035CBE9FE